MRAVISEKTVKIPRGVEVTVKKRFVHVKGPKGELSRSFRHMTIFIEKSSPNKLTVKKYFGMKKDLAAIKTIASHLSNMFEGVRKGYEVRMKVAFAHFPITLVLSGKDKCNVEIRNFLGCHKTINLVLPRNVVCKHDEDNKNEIILSGIDIERVTRAAALIQQSARPRGGLDLRKFLDGIYVYKKGFSQEMVMQA